MGTLFTALGAAAALSNSNIFPVHQGGARALGATGTQLLALVGTAYVPLAGGTMTGALTINTGAATTLSADLSGYLRVGSVTTFEHKGLTAITGLLISSTSAFQFVRAYGFIDANAWASIGANSFGGTTGVGIAATSALQWSTVHAAAGAVGVSLWMDAAATLAQRNGTTQQIFRLYNTYTDASNYERLTLTGVSGTSVNIKAETLGTGADNLDIVLTPAGTGGVVVANSKKLTAVNIGTYAIEDSCTLHAYNAYGLIFEFGSAKKGYMNTDGFKLAAANYYGWVSDTDPVGSAADTALFRNAAGIVEVNNGTIGTFRDLKLRNLLNTEYHQMTEMAAPSAPATNSVRIYAEDNGSGKTRLMAIFATGAAQQIAIEP